MWFYLVILVLLLIIIVFVSIRDFFRKVYAKKVLKKYEGYSDILFSYLKTSKTIDNKVPNKSQNESFTLEYLATFQYSKLKNILTIKPEELNDWRIKLTKLFELNKRYPLAIFPISRSELVIYRSDAHNWYAHPTIFDDKTLSFWPKHIIEKLLATNESTFELSQSLNSFYADLDYTIEICSFHSKCIQNLYKDKTGINNHELAKLQANPFEKFQAHFKKDVFEYAYQTIRGGHGCFYHFTDRSNLNSIIECGGLYSWSALNEKGITSKMGGNSLSHDLDFRKGLHDYVRLSITTNHPMMNRLKNDGYDLILLQIHPIVAMLDGTLFSNINATDNDCKVGGELKNFESLVKNAGWIPNIFRVHPINLRTDSIYFKLNQGEVLVPHFLPIRYIMNIYDLTGHFKNNIQYDYSFYPQISSKIQARWKIKETRCFNSDEVAYVKDTKVVACKYGYSLKFSLINGETSYLPVLYSNNKITDGDGINLNSCIIATLGNHIQKDNYQVIIH